MSVATVPTHSVMEGGGSYNLHAKIPAGGGNLALSYLEKAAQSCTLPPGSDPIVIADYGSSQGKNSLAPMRAAIRCLRTRVGSERPIIVVHLDQYANDFNTLFDVLHADPERYSMEDPSVFPSAIGRSFYENVLPKEQVDLGWSSYAAVWLSRIPALIPGHFIALASTGEVRAAFDRQAADDWRLFASHGMFGISVAKQNPAAHIYASDWKNVLEVAQKNADAMGVGDRYHLIPGSAFETEFGKGYDLALVTNLLHGFDAPKCTKLMRKVSAALNRGGRAAIAEYVPNPDRVSPPTAAAFSLTMLAATPSGDAYTYAELEGILKAAGFVRVDLSSAELGRNRLVIAYR